MGSQRILYPFGIIEIAQIDRINGLPGNYKLILTLTQPGQDILYINFYSLNTQGSLFYRAPGQESNEKCQ